jgi:hypothetical protein
VIGLRALEVAAVVPSAVGLWPTSFDKLGCRALGIWAPGISTLTLGARRLATLEALALKKLRVLRLEALALWEPRLVALAPALATLSMSARICVVVVLSRALRGLKGRQEGGV